MLRTVTGDIESGAGGFLGHEHLQIDLRAYKGDKAILGETNVQEIIDDLRYGKAQHGLAGVVDATVEGAGRRPETLRRISEETKISVLAATGYRWELYTQATRNLSVGQICAKMVGEITSGCGKYAIPCGVIKVGTGAGSLGQLDERMFRGAALASRDTGAPIITHTTTEDQIMWQLEILEGAGADLSRVLIGHFDKYESAFELAREVGHRGAFVGIDQIGFTTKKPDDKRAELVVDLCEAGLERQIILSSDVSMAGKLRANGGGGYSIVFEQFLPLCRNLGLNEECLLGITCDNPRRLLDICV